MKKSEENGKHDRMKKIRDEVFNGLSLPLYGERAKNNVYPVIGEGSHDARIMFIGEAPGRNEAKTGRPFCGAAGKILDELLLSAGLVREEVYITNIVKDRPPYNRDPLPDEIEAYAPFLLRQIEIIKPSVLATLGRYSMNYILNVFTPQEAAAPISKIHGKVFEANAPHGVIKIVALYHPAAAVYNRALLETLKIDFSVLRTI